MTNIPGPKEFWGTLGLRATGATVVTVRGDTGPKGFLGLSASHVSASPPVMLVSLDKTNSSLDEIRKVGHFAVNYLPAEAQELLSAFGGRTDEDRERRFRDGEWQTLTTGAPVFGQAIGAFDCKVTQMVECGQTTIVIGDVVDFMQGAGKPLVLFKGRPMAAAELA